MTKEQWKTFGYMELAGLLIMPPITLVPGLVYAGSILGREAAKGIGRGATATARMTRDGLKRRRDRIAAEKVEAERQELARQEAERRRIEEANRPRPPTPEELIAQADAQLASEIERINSLPVDEITKRRQINIATREHRTTVKQIRMGFGIIRE